jgi:hypothetical protein
MFCIWFFLLRDILLPSNISHKIKQYKTFDFKIFLWSHMGSHKIIYRDFRFGSTWGNLTVTWSQPWFSMLLWPNLERRKIKVQWFTVVCQNFRAVDLRGRALGFRLKSRTRLSESLQILHVSLWYMTIYTGVVEDWYIQYLSPGMTCFTDTRF